MIQYSIENIDSASIRVYLKEFNGPLFYYEPDYLGFLQSIAGNIESRYAVATRESQIVGILPYCVSKDGETGSIVNSLPFFGSHGGPVVRFNDNNSSEIAENLIRTVLERESEQGMASITIVENPFQPLEKTSINRLGLECIDDRIGQFTFLPTKNNDIEDALFKMFHVKTRNAVRKGLSQKQVVITSQNFSHVQWLQHVHHESITGMGGTSKSLKIFNSLISKFPLGEKSLLYTGFFEDKLASALLVILYNKTVEYFTPVVLPEYRDKQLLPHLIFEAMKDLTTKGYELWNWGGTWRSQEGVYRFKSRFGAVDKTYRYFNKILNSNLKQMERQKLFDRHPYFYTHKY